MKQQTAKTKPAAAGKKIAANTSGRAPERPSPSKKASATPKSPVSTKSFAGASLAPAVEAAPTRQKAVHFASQFSCTYVDLKKLPSAYAREIAFVGRSNAGKSSLLNSLVNRKDLARTSGMPGKTQALNFFSITWQGEFAGTKLDEQCFFVDLPGYGYAKVSKSLREQFEQFVHSYIRTRKQLRAVVLVCDSRRDPEEEEAELSSLRRNIPVLLVLTKIDKLSGNELSLAKKRWSELFPRPFKTFYTSSKERSKHDLEKLRKEICRIAGTAPPLDDDEPQAAPEDAFGSGSDSDEGL